MSVTRLMCPGCSAPLTPPEGRTQFFCKFCGATVVVPEEPKPASDPRDETLHPLPSLDRITIERAGGRLALSWQWRTWLLMFLVPFAMFWNGFLVVMTLMLVGSGELWPLLFLSLFYAVGLSLLYLCASLLVNGTTIGVGDGVVTVSHGPLPWISPAPVPVDDIEQFYVKEKVQRGKDSTSVQYSLELIRKSGGTVKLITGQYDADIPRTIERLLETHLGIADRPVKGEYTG